MALSIYWWLLIWLFLGGFLLNNLPKRREQLNGKIVERWDILPAILMVLPYIIWAGFRKDGADTRLYTILFLNASSSPSDIPALFMSDIKDPGYTALTIIFKAIFGDQTYLFFLMIASIQILCVALIFRKYSSDFWTCIFLFVASTDYISWTWNGMRQFIAVAIIFACFKLMLEKKYISLTVIILLASLIHGSAILMIPIIFMVQGSAWNNKTILMLIVTMIVVAYIDRFTPMLNDLLQETQYEDVMTNEIWTADDGANIIRVLVYSVPALFSLLGLRHVRAANDPVINICVNCSIFTMALYLVASVTSGIYIGRLPIYTTLHGYIALPWLIDKTFTHKSAKLVNVAMVILFACFFYYQVFIVWS